MSYSELIFSFSTQSGSLTTEDFVVRISQGIQDKATLLAHYADAGHFPDYFGSNWDALEECLRDFSWIDQKRIVIVHDDLPLSANEKELLTYSEILDATVKFWKQHEQHELLVIFPLNAEAIIARLLKSIPPFGETDV